MRNVWAGRLRLRSASAALEAWRERCLRSRRALSLLRRCVGRMRQAALVAAWNSWLRGTAEARLLGSSEAEQRRLKAEAEAAREVHVRTLPENRLSCRTELA